MDYQLLFIVIFLLLFVSFESIDKKHRYTESDINKNFKIEQYDSLTYIPTHKPFLTCSAKSLLFIERESNQPNLILSKQPGKVRQCRQLY
jgi:hypothetical protein